jgi:hypothetical protein
VSRRPPRGRRPNGGGRGDGPAKPARGRPPGGTRPRGDRAASPARGAPPARGDGAPGGRASGSPGISLPAQLALLALAFAVGVGAAELAGAANLGVAFGVGQIAFALTLVALLLRRSAR